MDFGIGFELLDGLSDEIVCRLDQASFLARRAKLNGEALRCGRLSHLFLQIKPLIRDAVALVDTASVLCRDRDGALDGSGAIELLSEASRRQLPARDATRPPWDGRIATIWPEFIGSKLSTGEFQKSRKPELDSTFRTVTWLMGNDFSLNSSEDDLAEFKRRYLSLPKHYKTMRLDRKDGGRWKSYDELMIDVEGLRRSGSIIPNVKPITFNKHKSTLSSCINWASGHRRSQYSFENRLGPLHIKVKRSSQAAKLERNMTPNAFLLALFKTPVWYGRQSPYHLCRPGPLVIRDSLYWVPLMITGNGLRREEACQLRVRHIVNRFDIWCYDLLAADIKVKTPDGASPRLVPIHKEILRAGFLEGVFLDRAPDALLFPDLSDQNAHGSFGVSFGKRISNYVANAPFNIDFLEQELLASLPSSVAGSVERLQSLKRDVIAALKAKFSNHGIRHWWKTYAINSGCNPDFVDDNLGHVGERRAEGRRYLKEVWVQNVKAAVDMVPMPFDGAALKVRAERSFMPCPVLSNGQPVSRPRKSSRPEA